MQRVHAADQTPQLLLDAQRLDCYRVAIQFASVAARLVPRGHSDLRSQLSRAAASVALNLAEGAGRRGSAERAHFYSIARGSAMECGAVVDLVRSLGLASVASCEEAHWLLVRIVQMLSRLEAQAASRGSRRTP